MSVPTNLQIAIDGPAASGKTTVALAIARRLQLLYLDTGAMYRALAYLALTTRTDADNAVALVRLSQSEPVVVMLDLAAPMGFRIQAGGRTLDEGELQSNAVTAVVSTIAAHPEVRDEMVLAQRRIAADGPVVMAGRDIGTIVLPHAPVKIFLTASIAARVARRRAQMERAGVNVDVHRLSEEIEERDRLDRSRPVAPLVPAADARIIDSSEMTVAAVVDEICEMAERVAP